jgi:hypothetical protein
VRRDEFHFLFCSAGVVVMKSLRAVVRHPIFWGLFIPIAAFGLAKAASAPIFGPRILAYALGLTIPGIIAGCLLPVPACGWQTLSLLILPFGGWWLGYRFC